MVCLTLHHRVLLIFSSEESVLVSYCGISHTRYFLSTLLSSCFLYSGGPRTTIHHYSRLPYYTAYIRYDCWQETTYYTLMHIDPFSSFFSVSGFIIHISSCLAGVLIWVCVCACMCSTYCNISSGNFTTGTEEWGKLCVQPRDLGA